MPTPEPVLPTTAGGATAVVIVAGAATAPRPFARIALVPAAAGPGLGPESWPTALGGSAASVRVRARAGAAQAPVTRYAAPGAELGARHVGGSASGPTAAEAPVELLFVLLASESKLPQEPLARPTLQYGSPKFKPRPVLAPVPAG